MLCSLTSTLPNQIWQDEQTDEIKDDGTRTRSRFPFAQTLLLKPENAQPMLHAPWMTSRRRYKPEKKPPLSPLLSQLVQRLYFLHGDSCVTEKERGKGALEVYGLSKSVLPIDIGYIESKPDLNDGWVDASSSSKGQVLEADAHEQAQVRHCDDEEMIPNDPNDIKHERSDWSSEPSSSSGCNRKCPIDTMDLRQPCALNTDDVGCARAYYDDSIDLLSSIGDSSIVRPDDPSSSPLNGGEWEQPASTPFFQSSSNSEEPFLPLLPPPTPRPRSIELTDTETDLDSDPASPVSSALFSFPSTSPSFILPHNTSTSWKREMLPYPNSLDYSSGGDESYERSTSSSASSDDVMTKTPFFVHSVAGGKGHDIGLDDTRPRTAYGRLEVYSDSDAQIHLSEPPQAPRLDAFSDDFDKEGEEDGLNIHRTYDPDAIYLYDPFDLQLSSSDFRRNSADSEEEEDHHHTQSNGLINPYSSQPHSTSYISSYTNSSSSPANPPFPPGLNKPPKKSRPLPSSYALTEKSQWKLAVTQHQRSLSTRGVRHPGFPPSPLGPNWEKYYGRVYNSA